MIAPPACGHGFSSVLLVFGLLQPNVNSGRTACSHSSIAVTENGRVSFAVTVKIADVDSVLVVDAIFERNPLHERRRSSHCGPSRRRGRSSE